MLKLTYPDTTQVSVGDHIWWNEGSCVGFVHEIVESEQDQKTWGFDGQHILLSGFHPFDSNTSGYVACSVSALLDEGIEKLSPEEERDFERAVNLARSVAGFVQPFQVRIDTLSDSCGVWIFGVIQSDEFREFARIKRSK